MTSFDPLVAGRYRMRRRIAVACILIFYAAILGIVAVLIEGGPSQRLAEGPLPLLVILPGAIAALTLKFGYRCPVCGAAFGRMRGFWPPAFEACPVCAAPFVPDARERPQISDTETIVQFQLGRARLRPWTVVGWTLILAGFAAFGGAVLLRIGWLAAPAFMVAAIGVVTWSAAVSRFLRCPRCQRTPLVAGFRGGIVSDPSSCPHCGARLR